MRHMGIADEVHRLLGGWASLTSSRGYFALTASDQFQMTHKCALRARVPPDKDGIRLAPLEAVRVMTVTG